MQDTRVLVTGKYQDESTYILYNEDGSVFQVIKEGEPFRIGNQMKEWVPVKVQSKFEDDTVLVCRKYDKSGKVIKHFSLPQNKKGLWALTAGAARRGVFHRYHEPTTELEKALSDLKISQRVIKRVDEIDVRKLFKDGDCGFGYISDCRVEELTSPEDKKGYKVRIYDGTYAICYDIDAKMKGPRRARIREVIVTTDVDEEMVAEQLRILLGEN